jgi:3-oxoacyl-(acyl-carrier-protein) synthase/acyl carrier protein
MVPVTAVTETPARPADGFAAVLEAVAEALGLSPEAIDPDASFRDYGVDSITGVAVVRKLNQRLGSNLPVTVVFDHPSVRALASAATGAVVPTVSPGVAARQPAVPRIGSAEGTEAIREALAEALSIPLDAVTPDSDVQDLGLDLVAAHAAARRLSGLLGRPVDSSLLFECRTPAALAAALAEKTSDHRAARQRPSTRRAETGNTVAVIGMAGRFPGAPNLDAFWDVLANGRDCVTEVPPERWDGEAWYDPDPERLDRTNCKRGGFVADVDLFEPAFFGLSFREACLMDPQQRLFLEACWMALADGGYQRAALEGAHCGVFAGVGEGDYLTLMEEAGVLRPGPTFWGNSISALPARIAYLLDLRGPALAIDTACSSSLVAVHQACRSVTNGECDVALAGGAHIRLTQRFHIAASNAGMLSTAGRCAAFDDAADGFVPGEGVGVVLLKRLDAAIADGDRVHGIIRGSAINQDGRTNGLTAPSARAQTDVELAAWQGAGIDPATISYVEAHGTGTPLGDPVEVAGLTAAFRAHTDRRQFCAIGSVKTNIGHASMAAGVAGLLKVLLMMRHRKIPPSLHFHAPNRHIDFAASPFRVATGLVDWRAENGPLRATVSSFGMSGTNAHVVIEQAPDGVPVRPPALDGPAMNRRRCWFDLVTEGTFAAPVPGADGGVADAAVRRALVRAEIADVLGLPPVALAEGDDLAAQGLSPVRVNALRRRLASRFAIDLAAGPGAATLEGWIAAVEKATTAQATARRRALGESE